jgi:hypothetical protein
MADAQARRHAIQKASGQVRSGGGFFRRATTTSVQRPRDAPGGASVRHEPTKKPPEPSH